MLACISRQREKRERKRPFSAGRFFVLKLGCIVLNLETKNVCHCVGGLEGNFHRTCCDKHVFSKIREVLDK